MQTAQGETASDASRTMPPVAFTEWVGQWRIHDEHNRRECKHGGARLTTLLDWGSVNRLVLFLRYSDILVKDRDKSRNFCAIFIIRREVKVI